MDQSFVEGRNNDRDEDDATRLDMGVEGVRKRVSVFCVVVHIMVEDHLLEFRTRVKPNIIT